MLYKNVELHNVAELIQLEDGVTWRRFPSEACESLEKDTEQKVCTNTTGVEIRFVMKSDEVRIVMASLDPPEEGVLCSFNVCYGEIQGGWADHEMHKYIGNTPTEFIFTKNTQLENHKRISEDFGYSRDPEVVRIIFNRGHVKLIDIIGDVEPPKAEQQPQTVILNYGSSITHGSNSIDMLHSWSYVTAHNLNCECRNLGMAGSCAMEPKVIDYIASEGEKGKWDIATLELGINVLEWEESKIYERATYAIEQVALRNPNKPIIVISPFYCHDDFNKGTDAPKWRRIIEEIVNKLNLKNVYYKSGLEFIDNMSYISADLVHPNIYGVRQIADRLTEYIKNII